MDGSNYIVLKIKVSWSVHLHIVSLSTQDSYAIYRLQYLQFILMLWWEH